MHVGSDKYFWVSGPTSFLFWSVSKKAGKFKQRIAAKTNPFLSTFWPNYYIFLHDKTLVSVIKNHHSLLCYLGTKVHFVVTFEVIFNEVPFFPLEHCRNVLCPDVDVLYFCQTTLPMYRTKSSVIKWEFLVADTRKCTVLLFCHITASSCHGQLNNVH